MSQRLPIRSLIFKILLTFERMPCRGGERAKGAAIQIRQTSRVAVGLSGSSSGRGTNFRTNLRTMNIRGAFL